MLRASALGKSNIDLVNFDVASLEGRVRSALVEGFHSGRTPNGPVHMLSADRVLPSKAPPRR